MKAEGACRSGWGSTSHHRGARRANRTPTPPTHSLGFERATSGEPPAPSHRPAFVQRPCRCVLGAQGKQANSGRDACARGTRPRRRGAARARRRGVSPPETRDPKPRGECQGTGNASPAARHWGNYHGTREIGPVVNRTFEC